MAADPQTLNAEAACYVCFGASEVEADELALLARWAGGQGNIPAPTDAQWTFTGFLSPGGGGAPDQFYATAHIVGPVPAGVNGYFLRWSEDNMTWQDPAPTNLATDQSTETALTGSFYGMIAWAINGLKVSDYSPTKFVDGPSLNTEANVPLTTETGGVLLLD